jgi:hypothetical protein
MPQPSCRACRVVSSGVPARRRCSIA